MALWRCRHVFQRLAMPQEMIDILTRNTAYTAGMYRAAGIVISQLTAMPGAKCPFAV
jgi:hypothetical protein